ncbi:MAG: 50S ribosomal protein L16 [Candidatus Bathyarchaeia archaeon]
MKGRNYRTPKGMPYVRKEYIHGSPPMKISKFTMGNTKADYPLRLFLISLRNVQIRHTALEAARVAVNKVLYDKLGETGYSLKLRAYPHVILRENKMMAFAGADRLQEGMRRSFGKPMGLAARVTPGQPLIEVAVNDGAVDVAKEALRLGMSKLPTPCTIEIQSLAQSKPSPT